MSAPFHLDALCKLMPQVTHIAAVGWRAAEQHFLALLGEHVRKVVAVTAVCGSETESKRTLERIRDAGVGGNLEPIPDSFTDSERRNGIEQFLK